MIILDVAKIFIPTVAAFSIGMIIAPFFIDFLFSHKLWKKKSGNKGSITGGGTPIFNKLHKEKDTGTPRMGGVVVWLSVVITVLLFGLGSLFFPGTLAEKLNFLSRNQTWIPFVTLIIGALIGLIDDILVVSDRGGYVGGGLSLMKVRIPAIALVGLVIGAWFFFKLGVDSIGIPFWGSLPLGLFFIPFFSIVMVAVFSGGVIDGLDGLSGGVLATVFFSYAIIAFFQNQIDLAAFSAVVAGATLAFLWFNIPPARFYMTETGMIALTMCITVVAFLTDQVAVLPIIAFPLFLSSASVILQVLSKKFRNGKKIFLVAPIHHHFEAIGWPSYKVTMRFWIVTVICSIFGVVTALAGTL
jgi:phospho-N-acetylmuramoyl-pentapeptide-transferase